MKIFYVCQCIKIDTRNSKKYKNHTKGKVSPDIMFYKAFHCPEYPSTSQIKETGNCW